MQMEKLFALHEELPSYINLQRRALFTLERLILPLNITTGTENTSFLEIMPKVVTNPTEIWCFIVHF